MAARVLRVFVALLLLLVTIAAACAALLGVAAVAPRPPIFLAAGWIVLALGTALAARVALSRPRRRWAGAGAVALVSLLAGVLVLAPLRDPVIGPAPVGGMARASLATGSRLAYVRVSASGAPAGAPIVFLHGGPGVADMRGDAPFFAQLAETGRDVVLYDQIGAGHSARLADPSAYTLERDLADLHALLGHLAIDRAVLIGHSYGGTLAAAYLARHPERVAAVIFLAPGAIRPHAVEHGTGMVDRLNAGQKARLYALLLEPRALLGWMLSQVDPRAAHAFVGDREMDARYDRIYARSAPGLYCDPPADLPLPHGLGAYTNANARAIPDLRPVLRELDTPALILKPQCDYLPPTFGTDLAGALTNARLVYVEGAGHSLYAERPDEVLAFVRAFLTGAPLPVEPRTDVGQARARRR